ncbi:zinc finger protein [Ciona intestinalis]
MMAEFESEEQITSFFNKTPDEVKSLLCREKRCPLCPFYRYIGDSPLQMHIQNAHIQHSVDFSYVEESVICLPCRRPCSDQVQRRPNHPLRSHFHCPFCLKIITRSTSFKNHIVRCTGSIVSESKNIGKSDSSMADTASLGSDELPHGTIQPMLDIFDVSPNDMTVLRNFVQLFQFNPYVLHSDEMLFLRKWLVDDLGAKLPEISEDEFLDEMISSHSDDEFSASTSDLNYSELGLKNDKLQVIVQMDSESFTDGTNNIVDQNGVNDISDVDENDGKIIVAIKSEPGDIANLYECTDCKQQFTSASGWQRHMEIYHSIDAHKLECQKCKYTFKDKHCLARHIRRGTCSGNIFIKHNIVLDRRPTKKAATEIPVSCPTCNLNFNMPHLMKKHAIAVHDNDSPFVCEHCGLSFQTYSNCRVHKLSHNDERPFACDQCEKRFKTKQLLTLHSYMHTGEKPYSCGKCDAKFRYRGTLVQHLSTVHKQPKPYLCNECGKSFCRINVFRYHQHTHTGFKPHKCKHCEKRFYTAHQLLLHQHNHDGKKLFHCKLCPASYCRSSALSKHVILKHTRNFKHRCPSCNKGFVFASILKKHMESVHKTDEPLIKTELIENPVQLFSSG